MKRVMRSMVSLVVGFGISIALMPPVFAGYGNHAERATANITTRVGTAKIRIEVELAELRDVAAAHAPTAP